MVAVMALAGLGVHLARVGLDEADKLASVLALFVGLAGLGATAYGLFADQRSGSGGMRQRARTGGGRVNQAGRDINQGPVQRPMTGNDGTDSSPVAGGDVARSMQQWAEASGNGEINQAVRDINKQ
ncbi:hypothetical protein [Planomonospora algeriensis]